MLRLTLGDAMDAQVLRVRCLSWDPRHPRVRSVKRGNPYPRGVCDHGDKTHSSQGRNNWSYSTLGKPGCSWAATEVAGRSQTGRRRLAGFSFVSGVDEGDTADAVRLVVR